MVQLIHVKIPQMDRKSCACWLIAQLALCFHVPKQQLFSPFLKRHESKLFLLNNVQSLSIFHMTIFNKKIGRRKLKHPQKFQQCYSFHISVFISYVFHTTFQISFKWPTCFSSFQGRCLGLHRRPGPREGPRRLRGGGRGAAAHPDAAHQPFRDEGKGWVFRIDK